MTPLRVLLVEDNPVDVLLVEVALEEMNGVNPELFHVERLSEAENLLESGSFDIVLLDLNLPDGEGLSNFERLHAVSPQTAVIMLTGVADQGVALQAIQSGAADYLIKGATDAPLLERSIRYCLERKRNENSRMELAREQFARAEAECANRAKDEFLAMLSHELRTPLNAILGWASLLRSGQLHESEQMQAVETIERNARVQAQLIEDLLDVSRIVTGNLRINPTVLSLPDVVRAALDATRPLADAKNIKVHVEMEEIPQVHGDGTRLQQVIWNLLSNSVKFTPVNGNIWVKVTSSVDPEAGKTVSISVRDDGQGIPPEFLPCVFGRFQQADTSSTRRHGGLGLGLAIVRYLVEAHGGRVRASSEGAGRGSCFEFELPVLQEGQKEAPALSPHRTHENGREQAMDRAMAATHPPESKVEPFATRLQ